MGEWATCSLSGRPKARPGEGSHWKYEWVLAPAVLLVTPEQHPSSCKEPSKLSISLVFLKQIYRSGICIHCFAFVYLSLSVVDCAFLGPFRIFPLWASINSGRKGCLQTRPHPDVHAVLTFSPVNPCALSLGVEWVKGQSPVIKPDLLGPGQGIKGLVFCNSLWASLGPLVVVFSLVRAFLLSSTTFNDHQPQPAPCPALQTRSYVTWYLLKAGYMPHLTRYFTRITSFFITHFWEKYNY